MGKRPVDKAITDREGNQMEPMRVTTGRIGDPQKGTRLKMRRRYGSETGWAPLAAKGGHHGALSGVGLDKK